MGGVIRPRNHQTGRTVAAWQAVYWLVPAEAESGRREGAWNGVAPTASLLRSLHHVLPPSKSWTPTMRRWGEYASHDVQAWFEAQGLATLQVRLDLRAPDLASVAERLSGVAESLGAVFEAADGVQLLPTWSALREHLQHTDAARFVTNPTAFLDGLRDRAV